MSERAEEAVPGQTPLVSLRKNNGYYSWVINVLAEHDMEAMRGMVDDAVLLDTYLRDQLYELGIDVDAPGKHPTRRPSRS